MERRYTSGINSRVFDKDIENYGLLRVTKKGKDFLKKPASFKITTADEEDLSDDENIDDVVVKGGGEDRQ
jgi:ATP-dependent DNA helicase RecQ (EC 3.6.1.-)